MPPVAPHFPAQVAFVDTDVAGLLVVDVLTERGPLALRTAHRPGGPGWAEWTAMALATVQRWADESTEVHCRVRADRGGRRCELTDGVRTLVLDLAVAPQRALLPGVVTTPSRTTAPPRRRRTLLGFLAA